MAGDISHLEATNPFYYHVAAHLGRHHIALYSLSFYGLYERSNWKIQNQTKPNTALKASPSVKVVECLRGGLCWTLRCPDHHPVSSHNSSQRTQTQRHIITMPLGSIWPWSTGRSWRNKPDGQSGSGKARGTRGSMAQRNVNTHAGSIWRSHFSTQTNMPQGALKWTQASNTSFRSAAPGL